MNIKSNEPSFKSRCAVVRDAQTVCRAVRNNFPYTAYSKAACEASANILKKDNIFDLLVNKNIILKDYREDRRYIMKPFNFYKEVLYSTIQEKIAACYELSVLAEMILRMNGITKCGKAGLVSKSGKRLNHCITYVQLSEKFDPKKVLIIDPWLQDADFLSNMLVKYKHHYKNYFKPIHPEDSIILSAKPQRPLDEKDIEYLKKRFPKLVFKEKLFTNK